MIVGSGLISGLFREFSKDAEVLIFASGVSNSLEIREEEFLRERDLLKKVLRLYPEKKIIYFSTTSIMDKSLQNSLYVKHKHELEKIIECCARRYNIFRLSQVYGPGGNPNNLINNLSKKIINSEMIEVYSNSYRNIIGVEDIKSICTEFIKTPKFTNMTINIASPWNVTVLEIISSLEYFLKKTALVKRHDIGFPIVVTTPEINSLEYKFTQDNFKEYFERLLNNYFGLS